MVFYGIVSPARQEMGDPRPTVAHRPVEFEDCQFLQLCPGGLQHSGVQVVVPSLAALFAGAAFDVELAAEHVSDHPPVSLAVDRDEMDDGFILGLSPGSSLRHSLHYKFTVRLDC